MARILVTAAALFGLVAVVASTVGYADARLAQAQGWGGDSAYDRRYADPVDEGGYAPSRQFQSQRYQADGDINSDGRWVERPGDAYDPAPRRADDSVHDWPAGSVYRDAWSPSGADSGWEVDGRSDGWRASNPEPAYRFRGDPPSGRNGWAELEADGGYRFRPLNERESERRVQERGWRPLERDSGSPAGRQPGQGGLIDALTPPARIYGFEPNPWP